MPRQTRFLVIWSVALVLILALAAGLNIVVNPYERFAWQRIPGVNLTKPAVKNHVALSKTYLVERARPVTAVLGTSRTYLGIDAASPSWPESFRPAFNYGIPASNITQSLLRELRQAWGTGRLRHAVVVLDPPAFFAPDPPSNGGEDERRLIFLDNGARNAGVQAQRFDDAFLSVFTLTALVDSVQTILAQGGGERVNDLRADGTATDAVFLEPARAEGMNAMFSQKDEEKLPEALSYRRLLANWRGPMPNLGVVREMIAFCREHNVTLTLILGSVHIDGMEIYRRAGLWPYIEQLKVDLATLVAEANSDTVTAWDFVEYTPYTTEAVPPPGDKVTPTRWFWEQLHFKKALGEAMLQRVFLGKPDDFGAPLTTDTVAERNKHVREQQQPFVGWRLACEMTAGDNCRRSAGAPITAAR